MTRRRTLLEKGYFPKELPPHFHTDDFARYASTKAGRVALDSYQAPDGITACGRYYLAAPEGGGRLLSLPHPIPFFRLVDLVAKNFKRLERKTNSPISRSAPVFSLSGRRALRAKTKYPRLDHEKALVRGGHQHLLRVDVSQFYPSLYTHALAWAIDPKLRRRDNWSNRKLFGNKIDIAVRDLERKVSQGLPIGNDISFLLGEIVLAQVDRSLALKAESAFRFFDDYEIACESLDEAHRQHAAIRRELAKFSLRLNPKKTQFIQLPEAVAPPWQSGVAETARRHLKGGSINTFFDEVFRIRTAHVDAPVLNYAIGQMFRVVCPSKVMQAIAQSAISQAILSEPGCTQKAFALLTYWKINGMSLDIDLQRRTVSSVVRHQRDRGFSSDVSWCLSFCVQQQIELPNDAEHALRDCEDSCIIIQSLHMKDDGLLSSSFKSRHLANARKNPDLDGEDWLLHYEAHRHRWAEIPKAKLHAHGPFGKMLAKRIGFYRERLPEYASLIHAGSAPEWLARRWLAPRPVSTPPITPPTLPTPSPVPPIPPPAVTSHVGAAVAQDIAKLGLPKLPPANDIAAALVRKLEPPEFDEDEVAEEWEEEGDEDTEEEDEDNSSSYD